jgi:hypothetical protein
MARGRTGRRRSGTKARRISFRVSTKIRRALAKARTVVNTAVVVGEVQNGKLKINRKRLATVTGRPRKKSLEAAPQIVFVALNAPFKTKALTGSL